MKTSLKDRTLWFDGTSEISSNDILNFIMLNPNVPICVDEITPEIKQYNKFVKKEEKICIKESNNITEKVWKIETEINVEDFVLDKFEKEISDNNWGITSPNVIKRAERVSQELKAFKKHNLMNLLRVLIYIINTLNTKNQVWGVGRGSSVSSYILYLIGVHDVDSVLYNIDFTDFIQE